LNRLLKRIDEPIAAILTLNTIAHTLGAAMGGAIALEVFGDKWIALFSAVLTLVFLVVALKPILLPLSLFTRLIQPEGRDRVTVCRAEIEVLAARDLRHAARSGDTRLKSLVRPVPFAPVGGSPSGG
jgi:hypothetical protein